MPCNRPHYRCIFPRGVSNNASASSAFKRFYSECPLRRSIAPASTVDRRFACISKMASRHINPFPHNENTVGKGEIARNEQFLLYLEFSTRKLSAIFTKFKIVVCRLFQFGRV